MRIGKERENTGFQEGVIARTKVGKDGHPIGIKGVVVYDFPCQDAGVVEIWEQEDYPIDTVDYRSQNLS